MVTLYHPSYVRMLFKHSVISSRRSHTALTVLLLKFHRVAGGLGMRLSDVSARAAVVFGELEKNVANADKSAKNTFSSEILAEQTC